jgi:hypothetical protein
MNEQTPLPYRVAAGEVARCVMRTGQLLARRRVHLRPENVGRRLRFADGTSARVYRETVVDGVECEEPCVLVVEFRLRLVRGWAHAVFRWESLLNTPLFVGFPGFRSKLWLAHDEHGVYRGLYQWNSARLAERYARSLWRVLAVGSVPGSIHYIVLPGLRRDDVLDDPRVLDGAVPDAAASWWRPVEAA